MANSISTATLLAGVPEPGSAEELRRFAALQERLEPLARRVLSTPRSPQTVVVVPSLTVCIGDSHENALKYYQDTVAVLDHEAQR